MATLVDRLTDEALSLPVDARLHLVETLLGSLNPPINVEHERMWAEEAVRRVAEIERGEAKLTPGDDVFARIEAKYRRR